MKDILCTDLGLGYWQSQAVFDRPREHCPGTCGQSAPAVLVLCGRGQTGQVLGPRIQQGMDIPIYMLPMLDGHSTG